MARFWDWPYLENGLIVQSWPFRLDQFRESVVLSQPERMMALQTGILVCAEKDKVL